MPSEILALLLTGSLQASTPNSFVPPPELSKAFNAAAAPIANVEGCVDRRPSLGLENQIEAREVRYNAAKDLVEQSWGVEVRAAPTIERRGFFCQPNRLAALLKQADSFLDQLERRVARETSIFGGGVWLGPIRFCQATIEKAEIGQDPLTGQPILSIALTSDGSASLEALTRRAPFARLAFRVGGDVVASPVISTQIRGGRFYISGPERSILEHGLTLISGSC